MILRAPHKKVFEACAKDTKREERKHSDEHITFEVKASVPRSPMFDCDSAHLLNVVSSMFL